MTAARTILGVTFNGLDRASAILALDGALAGASRTAVAFANAHTLNLACRDPCFRAELAEFFVLNDGVGVDLASRLKLGAAFTENLNGTDFIPDYLRLTAHSLRIFLLGGAPGVAATAAAAIQRSFPRHAIAGHHHGYFPESDNAAICAKIAQSNAQVVLVAMGNPEQEFWIARNAPATGATLLFGVGALFDFLAGRSRRAPRWVQRIRCEWVWRLAGEPRRLWRRYLIGNFAFLVKVLLDRSRSARFPGGGR